jgi:Raf kinase inhibitor-like YbhB/YbcL family protein
MNAPLQVTSTDFADGEMIPRQYTCDAANISPPLRWSGWPQKTQSFALLCEDPDTKKGTFTHWVMFNILVSTPEISEQIAPDRTLLTGALQGTNDYGKTGYSGPCPPSGTHRYLFKIYALDRMLDLEPGATRAQLLSAMQGHILAAGQLMGRYQRPGSL